jgi:hypothetical protein
MHAPHAAAEAIRVTRDIVKARRSCDVHGQSTQGYVSRPRECEAACESKLPVHRHRVASGCGACVPSFGPSGVGGTVQPGLRSVCRGLEHPRSRSGKRVHIGCLAGARRCRTLSECSLIGMAAIRQKGHGLQVGRATGQAQSSAFVQSACSGGSGTGCTPRHGRLSGGRMAPICSPRWDMTVA